MDSKVLENIGLTKSEVKVYLALIEIGSSTVGPITKKSGVASSKTAELLEKIQLKGLATSHKEGRATFYKAVSPNRILDYLEKQKKDLENREKKIVEFIPTLQNIFNNKAEETSVELFKGYKGVESVFMDMIRSLSKDQELCVIGGGDDPTTNMNTKLFFERIHKMRSKKGIKLKIIFSESRRHSLKRMALFTHTEPRYLSYGTPSTINIYKDFTILLVMSPTPAAIRIHNKKITESYRKYFEHMWKVAKK